MQQGDQEMQPEKAEAKAQRLKDLLQKPEDQQVLLDGEVKISKVIDDGVEQIQISHKSESPDPRVGGTKIIFDPRFDQLQQQNNELDVYLKIKAEQEKAK